MRDGLTHEELVVACRNIGYDLTCGQCASVFYTGVGIYPHDVTCSTPGTSNGNVEITMGVPIGDCVPYALVASEAHVVVETDGVVQDSSERVEVRVGGPGDTGCYSRGGKACEGYVGSGCRHCGRIIGSQEAPPLRPLADETPEK